MGIVHLIKYGLTLPPRTGLAQAGTYLSRRGRGRLAQWRDRYRETFAPVLHSDSERLANLVCEIDAAALAPMAETIRALSRLYGEHRFDLLGSGWRRVEYGMVCPGDNGKRFPPFTEISPNVFPVELTGRLAPGNRERAGRIRGMIDSDYRPIDWHIDFKSGFRWPENRSSDLLAYGHDSGADVKVPWELARLQHLPQLALAYVLAKSGAPDFAAPDAYAREFRNQALDFIAANPPRFGVNWMCPMDVAIRAANLLLAFDLFQKHGADFDSAFMREISAAAWAHGRHVAANLEWHPDFRGNHFLADVAGLAFIAAYLPATPETDTWLAVAVRHLIAEVERQFAPDGTNFEASTSYHRLAAETVVFTTALILGLDERRRNALQRYDHKLWRHAPPLPPAPVPLHPNVLDGDGSGSDSPFPPWYFERLEKMAAFSRDATKPNGGVVQIGDNDSGRFFKLTPTYRRLSARDAEALYADLSGRDDLPDLYWDEDGLDHRPLVAAVDALFGNDDFKRFYGATGSIDSIIVAGLARGATVKRDADSAPLLEARNKIIDEGAEVAFSADQAAVAEIALPSADLLDGLETAAYPDFGLFVWRAPRFFLSVRCGPVGQDGRGGHAHNDQLAVELQIDGIDWLADPGSACYTPALAERNAYRAAAAHAVPKVAGREPARLDLGVFRLEDNAEARCHRFDRHGFLGSHRGYGTAVYRRIEIGPDRITIADAPEKPVAGFAHAGTRTVLSSPADARRHFAPSVPFSPGYGKRRRA